MAINFQTFNPEQMAVVEALAKQLEAEPLLHEFVEFKGGWLPKLTYQQALRHNMLDRVDVVAATRTGAWLARNISMIASLGVKSLNGSGDKAAAEELQMAAHMAVRFMSQPNVNDAYHEWFLACQHVPADVSQTVLGLLFAGEILDRFVAEMRQELGGMIRAMMEARGATRH